MEEDDIISKFNEGQFQMLRGHNIQDLLNKCKLNLRAWNEEFQEHNYKIVLILLNNLFAETSSKLRPEELTKGRDFKLALEGFLDKHPIHRQVKKARGFVVGFDKKSFDIFNKEIFNYELLIRHLREKHGFSSPQLVEGLF